jgi:hypothetical protein
VSLKGRADSMEGVAKSKRKMSDHQKAQSARQVSFLFFV